MATIFKNHISTGFFARTFRRLFGLKRVIDPLLSIEITQSTMSEPIQQIKNKVSKADTILKNYSRFTLWLCGINLKKTPLNKKSSLAPKITLLDIFLDIVNIRACEQSQQTHMHVASSLAESATNQQSLSPTNKQPVSPTPLKNTKLPTEKSYLVIRFTGVKSSDEVYEYISQCQFKTGVDRIVKDLKLRNEEPWMRSCGYAIGADDKWNNFVLVNHLNEIHPRKADAYTLLPTRYEDKFSTAVLELYIDQKAAEFCLDKKESILSYVDTIYLSKPDKRIAPEDLNVSFATNGSFIKLAIPNLSNAAPSVSLNQTFAPLKQNSNNRPLLSNEKSYLVIRFAGTKSMGQIENYLSACQFKTGVEGFKDLRPEAPWMKSCGHAIGADERWNDFILVTNVNEVGTRKFHNQSMLPTRYEENFSTAVLELNIDQETAESCLAKKENILSYVNIIYLSKPGERIPPEDLYDSFTSNNTFNKRKVTTEKTDSTIPRRMP